MCYDTSYVIFAFYGFSTQEEVASLFFVFCGSLKVPPSKTRSRCRTTTANAIAKEECADVLATTKTRYPFPCAPLWRAKSRGGGVPRTAVPGTAMRMPEAASRTGHNATGKKEMAGTAVGYCYYNRCLCALTKKKVGYSQKTRSRRGRFRYGLFGTRNDTGRRSGRARPRQPTSIDSTGNNSSLF